MKTPSVSKKAITLIETMHTEYLNTIANNENSELHERLKMKEEELRRINQNEFISDEENHKKLLLENEVTDIKTKIRYKSSEDDRLTDYFLKTGPLLFEYYSSLETLTATSNTVSLMELFQKKSNEESNEAHRGITSKYMQLVASKDLSWETQSKNEQRILNIESENTCVNNCVNCNVEMVLNRVEAMLVCPTCSRIENVLIDSNRPQYKDPPRDFSSYSYKRINHFNEWLAQFQAKESTDIPEEVYNKILIELRKERATNINSFTAKKIKSILKRLGYSKYYEHVPHIIYHLTGQPAPVMTRATEEKLRQMFKEIQTPFLLYCPDNRKNFLSYSYCLHKLCQLLGLDEFLPCFLLLKSREKLHHQDVIWEQICNHLSWEFIKSV